MGRTACTEPQCLYKVTFTFYYLKKATTTSFPIISNAVLSITIIRRYVVGVTDSVIQRTANK